MAANDFEQEDLTADARKPLLRWCRRLVAFSFVVIVLLPTTAIAYPYSVDKPEITPIQATKESAKEHTKAANSSIKVSEPVDPASIEMIDDWRETQRVSFGNYTIRTETMLDDAQNKHTQQTLVLNDSNLLPGFTVQVLRSDIDVGGDGKADLLLSACQIGATQNYCEFVIADSDLKLTLRRQAGYLANSMTFANGRLKISVRYRMLMFPGSNVISGPTSTLPLVYDGQRFLIDEIEQLRKSPSVEDFEFCRQILRAELANFEASEPSLLAQLKAGEVLWRLIGTLMQNGNLNSAQDYLRNSAEVNNTPFLQRQQSEFFRVYDGSEWNVDFQTLARNIKTTRKPEDYQKICLQKSTTDLRSKRMKKARKARKVVSEGDE